MPTEEEMCSSPSQIQLSIIIPFTETSVDEVRVLSYLRKQTNLDQEGWECLLIRDGDIDTTSLDVNFKVYANKKGKGACGARNTGISLARGKYLTFLDADDEVSATYVSNRLSIIRESTIDLFICGTVVKNINTGEQHPYRSERTQQLFEKMSASELLESFGEYHLPWHTSSGIVRKQALERITFDEQLSRLQDVDFYMEVLKTNPTISFHFNQMDTFYCVEGGPVLGKAKKLVSSLDYFIFKHKPWLSTKFVSALFKELKPFHKEVGSSFLRYTKDTIQLKLYLVLVNTIGKKSRIREWLWKAFGSNVQFHLS